MQDTVNLADRTYSTFTEDLSSEFTSSTINSEQQNSNVSDGRKTSHPRHATSEWSSFINLFKANVGPGALAMPLAMSYTGLWLGLVGIPAVGSICIFCMHILVESNKELRRRLECGPLNMEETYRVAFSAGPNAIRKYAYPVHIFTKTFLFINQIGFCCIYFEFVAQNVHGVITSMTEFTNMTIFQCNMMLIIPFIFVSLVRYLKFVTYLSMVSSTAQVTGMVIILYYCTRDLQDAYRLPPVGNPRNLPLFLGSVIFTLEGIGAVLPIENEMRDSSNYGGLNGVLLTVMPTVLTIYTTVGFYGYLQYGSDILGSVSLNLPTDELLAQSVKIFMAVAIFLSFTIQLHVAVQVILKTISKPGESENARALKDYSLRVAGVIFSFTMASVIPNLGLFISLVGAAGGSTIAIILPAVCNLVTFWPQEGGKLPILRICQTFFLLLVGLGTFITGTITSLYDIIDFLTSPEN